MMRTITKREKKEIEELMGFTTVEYTNLRKSTKTQNSKLPFVLNSEGPIWTDSTVIVSD